MEISTEPQMLGKVVIAASLGAVVGVEREFAERPAGLRTHMLVGATAAFFVVLASYMIRSFEPQDIVTVDPVRVVEAIVVGISFLGAGTIFKYTRQGEGGVEGLTTSASLLSVAAIGIAVALDAYVLAVGVAFLNLFINWGSCIWSIRGNPNSANPNHPDLVIRLSLCPANVGRAIFIWIDSWGCESHIKPVQLTR